MLFVQDYDVGETVITGTEVTKVKLGEIPEKSLEIYSKIEDIRKSSGGYRVSDMGPGLSFISAVEGTLQGYKKHQCFKLLGCFGNVVGLPVHLFCKLVIEGIEKAGWIKSFSI